MEERIGFTKYLWIAELIFSITLQFSKNKQLLKTCSFEAHKCVDLGDWKIHSGFC